LIRQSETGFKVSIKVVGGFRNFSPKVWVAWSGDHAGQTGVSQQRFARCARVAAQLRERG
jgi:hypothetical protein